MKRGTLARACRGFAYHGDGDEKVLHMVIQTKEGVRYLHIDACKHLGAEDEMPWLKSLPETINIATIEGAEPKVALQAVGEIHQLAEESIQQLNDLGWGEDTIAGKSIVAVKRALVAIDQRAAQAKLALTKIP